MSKVFHTIPLTRPHTPLLDQADTPKQLRELSREQLPELVDELREYLLYSVGQSGGHFGAGLGVVELTVALHYLFNTPDDRLIWDVGHQAYPHKILTGRREEMLTIRQRGGLSGFPKRSESKYDDFGVGHSSTSISAALGMAIGAQMSGTKRRSVAVIGDGAMTAGMAFEALNHAAHTRANMLVVLNDNNMSISHNVGGLANYFARVWSSKMYISFREGGKKVLSSMPVAWDFVRRTEESMKGMVSPDGLFEAIGFNYIGPIDGHNLDELMDALENIRDLDGPQLLHIYTTKGKGFSPAEKDPIGYHALTKLEPEKTPEQAAEKASIKEQAAVAKKIKYQDIFGQWLCDTAQQDQRLAGITPAMCEGSGMIQFAQQFPERFHDVAIAEQHAVTLAAGMACEAQKPVVAIYSTFLQRAYDQLIHDVALQNLDVTFAIDRAGLVGEDGDTHAGMFDIAYLRCVPNMVIATPSDEKECRQLLSTAYQHNGPAAVRYPRGTGNGTDAGTSLEPLALGKGKITRQGQRIALINFGTTLDAAMCAAEQCNATVADMRFVKPIDLELLKQLSSTHDILITIEDHVVQGGAGSAVSEALQQCKSTAQALYHLGIADQFIGHGTRSELLSINGLDADGILRFINSLNT